jgi:hypothetical protein
MDWDPSQFHVINESPKIEFSHPIPWRAEKQLRDDSGQMYCVATALDPATKKTLLIPGSREEVSLRRLFRKAENGWELVEDKGLVFVALMVAEGR